MALRITRAEFDPNVAGIDRAPALDTHHNQIDVAIGSHLQNLAVRSPFSHDCFNRAVGSSLGNQLAQSP